jgi:hypothetical protein
VLSTRLSSPPRSATRRNSCAVKLARILLFAGAAVGMSIASAGPVGASGPAGGLAAPAPAVTQLPSQQPRAKVAILVHGFQGFFGQTYACRPVPLAYPAEAAEFGRLSETLRANGYYMYLARFNTSPHHTDTLEASARCLRDQIAAAIALHKTDNVTKVTLIAHSMGGVVSRRYIEDKSLYRGDVEHFVTFGSPHLGVPNAFTILAILNPLWVLDPCGQHPGMCELYPEAMRRFNAEWKPVSAVTYDFVGGTRQWFGTWLLIPGPDDGLIQTASATGLNVPSWLVPDSHSAGMSVDHNYLSSDESVTCLREILAIGPRTHRCNRKTSVQKPLAGAAGPAAASQMSDSTFATTPLVGAHLGAGQHRQEPVTIDGDAAAVLLSWTAGRPVFEVRAPDGTPFTAQNVAQVLPGSEYRAETRPDGSGWAAYHLARPAAGVWTAVIRGAGGAASDFALVAALSSPIRLTLSPLGDVVAGRRVSVEARVADGAAPLADAAVEAILMQSGVADHTPLAQAASGTYRGAVIAPRGPGVYQLKVRATGVTPGGIRFAREADTVIDTRPVPTGNPTPVYLPLLPGGPPSLKPRFAR